LIPDDRIPKRKIYEEERKECQIRNQPLWAANTRAKNPQIQASDRAPGFHFRSSKGSRETYLLIEVGGFARGSL